ncbi:PIH1 CS-like domain-containing protein [Chloropicon primus]|uniref:PIH1D1/2/3 CS-like domain-containing protein n=1 Tax=Chloropicon primus TaxID=1764295 RepID=A0A5B8MYG5_9CHLO|nr:hypothetical protein A3770_18p81150 [Chloropicon primus]UPR04794.1 PIH1 CS-like domain-containing protein [Chloropicon primus]|eukprot:QDZ25597.1 hypothetical protein A3770_18p81150 [Chloropicon primus]
MEINSLAELLTPSEDAGSARDDIDRAGSGASRPPVLHPGTIGAPSSSSASTEQAVDKKSAEASKEIWQDHEILDHVEDDLDDGLECPSYEFLYKQAVATEDVYLGLSGKDPSSTDCEDLVLKVFLDGTRSLSELELDVEDTYVKVRSPKYKLSLHLPHKTDSKKGSAKWDKQSETLVITLRIVREDPF